MAVVSMKQFLEAGVHYGHQTKRWNPKMRPFIFGARNGTHIIDLQKTLRMLKEAYEFVRDISSRGESVLFVGTKPQARDIIREEADRCTGFYINERWLGGLLTNFNTIKGSVAKMKKYEDMRGEDGAYEGIIKKESLQLEKKRVKLERALGGIRDMRRMPGAIFVVDCKKEKIALQEAQTLGIPIIAVVDTNCSPDGIDYVIPGNDDAIRAIRLFSHTIANAVMEGRMIYEAGLKAGKDDKPAKGAKDKGSSKPKAEKKPEKAEPQVAAEQTPAEAPAASEAKTFDLDTKGKTAQMFASPSQEKAETAKPEADSAEAVAPAAPTEEAKTSE